MPETDDQVEPKEFEPTRLKATLLVAKHGVSSTYTQWGAIMTAASENLLVKFRSKNTKFGVTRETVKALARKLDVNETQVIHMALSKLANDVLPVYELDDGPLTVNQIKALRNDVAAHYPRGKLLSRESLIK